MRVTQFLQWQGLTDTDGNATDNARVSVDPTRTSAYTATVRYTLATGDTGLGVKDFAANDAGTTTVHTAYGVRADSQNTFSTLSDGTTSPQTGAESSGKAIQVTTNQSWTKVTFSTTSGQLYSSGTSRYYYVSGSKLVRSLPSGSRSITAYPDSATDNVVEVQYRATGNTTATVTAMIPGSVNRASTHKVTVFFDSSVKVERISGNEQFGQINSDYYRCSEQTAADSSACCSGVRWHQRCGSEAGECYVYCYCRWGCVAVLLRLAL